MTQRISDCIEVLDLIRSYARFAPQESPSEWRRKSIAHVASRGVSPTTVFAHFVGKNTRHTLSARQVDRLVAAWITQRSDELRAWLLKSHSLQESERIRLFFDVEGTPLAIDINEPEPTQRHLVTTYRVLRDTAVSRRVKADMAYTCQICADRIVLGDGTFYAEAHHVRPLGSPHDGPDHLGNIVCVCPNCHVRLDYGAIPADPAKLTNVSPEHIDYHNKFVWRGRMKS